MLKRNQVSEAAPGVAGAGVLISVVSHGHGAMILDLLDDLDAEEALAGADVVVTHNIPEAFSLGHYRNIRVTKIENAAPRGFAENHNTAFHSRRSKLFLVLNPDVRLPRNGFAALRAEMNQPNAGLAVPEVYSPEGTREDSVRANITPLSIWSRLWRAPKGKLQAGLDAQQAGGFFWAAGMFMLFRSEAYAQIGGFDERFFLYCEDYDICARLWLRGWAIRVSSEYRVVHDARRASRKSLRHLWWHVTGMLKLWVSPSFLKVSAMMAAGHTPRAAQGD